MWQRNKLKWKLKMKGLCSFSSSYCGFKHIPSFNQKTFLLNSCLVVYMKLISNLCFLAGESFIFYPYPLFSFPSPRPPLAWPVPQWTPAFVKRTDDWETGTHGRVSSALKHPVNFLEMRCSSTLLFSPCSSPNLNQYTCSALQGWKCVKGTG